MTTLAELVAVWLLPHGNHELKKAVRKRGAKLVRAVDPQCDVIVAASRAHAGVRGADVPVVGVAFLRDCVAAERVVPIDPVRHLLPPFAGLVFTSTGFDIDERTALSNEVAALGGAYAKGLEEGTTTHLIVKSTANYAPNSKYDVVKRENVRSIACVSANWVRVCGLRRALVPEFLRGAEGEEAVVVDGDDSDEDAFGAVDDDALGDGRRAARRPTTALTSYAFDAKHPYDLATFEDEAIWVVGFGSSGTRLRARRLVSTCGGLPSDVFVPGATRWALINTAVEAIPNAKKRARAVAAVRKMVRLATDEIERSEGIWPDLRLIGVQAFIDALDAGDCLPESTHAIDDLLPVAVRHPPTPPVEATDARRRSSTDARRSPPAAKRTKPTTAATAAKAHPRTARIAPLTGKRVSCSGFTGRTRDRVKRQIVRLGGEYSDALDNKCHCLVVEPRARSGAKYKRAVEWGLDVRDAPWLQSLYESSTGESTI